MKKLICVFCILAVLFVSTACQADDPENLFSTSPEDSASTTESEESTAPEQERLDAEAGYSYGNMQKNIPSGNFMPYEGSVLFDQPYGGDAHLLAYDMETGEVTPFCKDATCTHTSAKCAAGSIFGNLERCGDDIYARHLNGYASKLVDGKFERITKGSVGLFWHNNGKMYVRTLDGSLVVYEKEGGEPRVILDEYTSYWNVIFGHYLYGCYGEQVTRVDLESPNPTEDVLMDAPKGYITDGEYIYFGGEDTYFYRCNMDGSNPTLLFEKWVSFASINFDDEYLYFRLVAEEEAENATVDVPEKYDLFRCPKSDPTKLEKIATFEEEIFQVFTVPGYDKIFVYMNTDTQNNELPPVIYTVGRDGSNPQRLDLPEF